jgi:hypothetical protein
MMENIYIYIYIYIYNFKISKRIHFLKKKIKKKKIRFVNVETDPRLHTVSNCL